MEKRIILLSLLIGLFVLSSCSSAGKGTLVLQITDAPSDLNIQKALITISQVQVHKSGDAMGNITTNTTETPTDAGWITIVSEPQTFDLIAIKDVKEFLGSNQLEPGKYTQIRLTIEKALVTIDDKEYDLTVPSSKLRLIQPFTIEAGKNTTLTLDFDAQQSIISTGSGKFNLRPTVKVIQE